MPVMRKDEAGKDLEDLSITPIYEAGRSGKLRLPSVMDVDHSTYH